MALFYSKGIVPNTLQGYDLTNLNVDIPEPTKFLEGKKHILKRFIGVMVPILDLYELPLAKLHIFYDLDGSAFTFNHNGSIFMNLRHYEKCRMYHFLRLYHIHSSGLKIDDEQVRSGTLVEAYTWW